MNNIYYEVQDPQTGQIFFANTTSGQCLPERPADGIVKMRDPDLEEWWELFDENYKLPYYYNPKSAKTEWIRPVTGFILPLRSIQQTKAGKRMTMMIQNMNKEPDIPNDSSSTRQITTSATYSLNRADVFDMQEYGYDAPGSSRAHETESSLMSSNRASRTGRTAAEVAAFAPTDADGSEPPSASPAVHGSSMESVESPLVSTQPRESNANSILPESSITTDPLQAVSNRTSKVAMYTISSAGTDTTHATAITSNLSLESNRLQTSGGASQDGPHTRVESSSIPIPPAPPAIVQTFASTVGDASVTHTMISLKSDQSMVSSQMPSKASLTMEPSKQSIHTDAVTIAKTKGISNPINNPEAAIAMNPFNKENDECRGLPSDLKVAIGQFRIDGFAEKYFSQHRAGLFRRKVPLEKMLVYSKTLKAPLMVLNKKLHKDALKCFKLLSKIIDKNAGPCKEEIQALTEKGILHGELRDEIYVQIIKQLKDNPSGESVVKAWKLLCVVTIAFPPSKNFEEYLKSYVQENFSQTGSNADQLTILEAPFQSALFGETLEEIMREQAKTHPELDLPKILSFLATAILDMNGCGTEGIFRVPGDADAVTDLKCRVEKNAYDLSGITDPNVPSSLLKLWLRDLAEPLIPSEF
ncbi:MyTH4 domain-containing protein [Polychytrium aggregatum]|uniref:MyTH4 domain-containing protein n=1 Tax=Polychytrium aggregatum TaxID=110093 RepID=UPI0022FF1D92|nr:MyTH4 domain-containing protein [Polychytrium aggregatum]KAI9205889.1 MyTH4 domain-containing protein [Polychytrium aggregatum]